MFAYDGVPEDMPAAALGSYELLGLDENICFDRFARYGPYGFGYNTEYGGIGLGNDTESSDSLHIWTESGKIDYRNVDWADAQKRCQASNQHRFQKSDDSKTAAATQPRTAIVVRCYEGFNWTPMVVLNFRAMITELSLKSGGEYSIHLLMEVKDKNMPIWADRSVHEQYLQTHVPAEFHGLVTFWSEPQMKLFYAGDFSKSFRNPSGHKIHHVLRSPHLPLQLFAKEHSEYTYFWNWEMDVRATGSYYEILDRIGTWSDGQSRELLWEQNERYYIPAHHQSWSNFTRVVHQQASSSNQALLGPVRASWRKKLAREENGESNLPEDCLQERGTCGVGEGADLITLNPIFNTRNSDWFYTQDVTGYDRDLWDELPRRASIITVARYSRRMLLAMHEEVWRYQHSMFAEMFPTTVAFHHGFKAVYAPHPVYINREWPSASELDKFFNSGEKHSTSGRNGPFSLSSECIHKITSWYYLSHFPEHLWRRWLGYADRKGRGGIREESAKSSKGRMCLRSMLLHPIKREHPSE